MGEEAFIIHISWLQSLNTKYLRMAKDKDIFFYKEKIQVLRWAWKEQKGVRNFRTMLIIINDYYCFAMAKRPPHFTLKKSRPRKRKQITKRCSTVSVRVGNKTQLRSYDSQARALFFSPNTASIKHCYLQYIWKGNVK